MDATLTDPPPPDELKLQIDELVSAAQAELAQVGLLHARAAELRRSAAARVEAAKALGLTQRGVAARIGMKESTLRHLIKVRRATRTEVEA